MNICIKNCCLGFNFVMLCLNICDDRKLNKEYKYKVSKTLAEKFSREYSKLSWNKKQDQSTRFERVMLLSRCN